MQGWVQHVLGENGKGCLESAQLQPAVLEEIVERSSLSEGTGKRPVVLFKTWPRGLFRTTL